MKKLMVVVTLLFALTGIVFADADQDIDELFGDVEGVELGDEVESIVGGEMFTFKASSPTSKGGGIRQMRIFLRISPGLIKLTIN